MILCCPDETVCEWRCETVCVRAADVQRRDALSAARRAAARRKIALREQYRQDHREATTKLESVVDALAEMAASVGRL